jgi:hypothetical protein
MAGDLLRATGLLPAAALVADPGTDAQQYNWLDAPSMPASFWSPGPVAVGGWDALSHRAGAFDVGTASHDQSAMLDEVAHATAMGLTLAVNGYIGRDNTVVQSSLDHDLMLIDTYPWDRIAAACGASAQAQACSLTQDQLALIEQEVRHHLQVTRPDDTVVGYWVLDDDPGDVRSAIELIHRLVQQENLLGHAARPTICGFGGDLAAGPLTAAAQARFDQIASNFTPTGCDAVAVYPYARPAQADETETIDWSMSQLLPYMLARLRQAGWDPTQQPLIGVPQAFRSGGLAAPAASELAAQTDAYCAAGASTILFFSWHDGDVGDKAELFNAPDLRLGATTGLAQCQAVWGRT